MRDFFQDKELFDISPIGVIVVSRTHPDLKILYYSDFFIKLGLSLDKGLELAAVWPEITGPIPDGPIVTSFNQHWLKLQFQPGLWQGQKAILIWAHDISDTKERETSLQNSIESAGTITQNKANFLATMSHELRTPMQTVFGLLELIALENPPASIREMIEVAKTASSGMLEILDDILDLAKIDAQKMELDMFEVPLRTLTRGVLEALAVKVKNKPVILVDEIDADVPALILGDPKRLRQILLNLTGNALKFTDEGIVKIRIIAKPVDPATDTHFNIRFEIIDSGIGMTEETQKKLFNTFTQADSSTSRKYGGTGLGLSICKKLVEAMNGHIGVNSQAGEGSVFWFEIPAEKITAQTPFLKLPDLSGLSVLSVEDHPQGAKEIVHALRSMGAAVESCATCAEAMSLVRKRPFDVGVIDQGLPDGLGLDLIRDIMSIRPFMGLFMYTVRDDAGLLHSLQSLGIAYVGKPASRLGLGQKVLEVVTKSSLSETKKSGRLLIAEDMPSIRDILKRQLKTLKVEADFVTNGAEAIAALASGNYGILFTDLHMPKMDGYELVKLVRDKGKTSGEYMPIVVLTADIQMAQRHVYTEHGFDECLLKPISLGHFKRLLIRWGVLQDTDEISSAGNTPDISLSSIDMRALQDQMGNFDDSAKEMLAVFADMTLPLMEKLQTETAIESLAKTAHSLKGSARSAGAVKLGDIASEIQKKSEEGFYSKELVAEAMAEFNRVKLEIETLISA